MENMGFHCLQRSKKNYFDMYNTTKPYTDKILKIIERCRGKIPASTDGVGTKGIYHWQQKTFRNAVLDALAMNLNDMAVIKAKAIGLHNHIMIPEDDEKAILEIVGNFAEECEKRNISIYSGETSIHDNLKGLEISVSVAGEYVDKNIKDKNTFEADDILLGIKSSGLHSNGFTKVREVFAGEFRKEFIEPTLIYYDSIIKLIRSFDVHGMCHITSGAYAKIKKLIGNADIEIKKHSLKPQDIFYELYSKGISDEEMYKTFNCGICFILFIPEKNSEEILKFLNQDFESGIIGRVNRGNGKIKIESMFSDKKIVL